MHYRLEGDAERAAAVRLVDAGRAVVPSQVRLGDDGRPELWLVTSLPANGTVSLAVRSDASVAQPQTPVAVTAGTDGSELTNGVFTVRCPAAGETHFDPPVPASQLPAPIRGFRHGAGGWRGGGRVLSPRPVSSFKVEVTARGPVFAEVRCAVAFAGGGWYRASVRVADRLPFAEVREEYDAGDLDGGDFWELDLTRGWAPDMMEVASATSGTGFEKSKIEPLAKLGPTPDPIQAAWTITPDSAWYDPRTHLGFFVEAESQASPEAYAVAGFVPLHKGDWRRTNAIEIHTATPGQVCLRLPMSVRHASWLREVASENSPFSCHEHEPGLPVTYGRRVWALVLAHPDVAGLNPTVKNQFQGGVPRGPLARVRSLYGIVGLDRYKDYILEWPDTGAGYPRVFLRPEQIPALRQNLDKSPLAAALRRDSWLASGDETVATAALERTMRTLEWHAQYMLGTPTVGHHAMSGAYLKAAMADDVLAWPALPASERAALRARLALITYLYGEGDVITYANGCHTGPPNMGLAVSGAAGTYLALLPDHPMFERWRTHLAAYADYKMGANLAPGGGWFEYGGAYHMHGFARLSNGVVGLAAAEAPGRERLLDGIALDWSYYLNLLTPFDTRWGARMVPGLANSMPSFSGHFMEASGALSETMPELAAHLRWAWLANGSGNHDINPALERPWIEPKEPALASQIYPGVGVIFRAHQGPRETFMFLRAGYNWSHWTEDQGHFMLMSDGAVLMPFQSYQYGRSSSPEFDVCNLLRFGHPANRYPHSWPDSNVLAHAFGPTADYAWVSTGFPDWYIDPGTNPDFAPPADAPVGKGQLRPLAEGVAQQPGPFAWNRQVVFLKRLADKGADTFVFRDAATGPGRLAAWMNFNLLGRQADVTVTGDRIAVATEWPVTLNLAFPGEKGLTPDFYEQTFNIACWGGGPGVRPFTDGKPTSRNWVMQDGKPFTETPKAGTGVFEQHVVLRLPRTAGQDSLWALWPGRADTPPPALARLADGVLKITTAEETSYVFLDAAGGGFAGEDVVFAGSAGVVRIRDGRVRLALLGAPGRVGYKGHIIEGGIPFEQTVSLSGLEAGVHAAPSAAGLTYEALDVESAEVVPGLRKAVQGDVTEYVITGASPVRFAGDGVEVEAAGGALVVSPAGVRFVAPDRGYVRLSAGAVGVRGTGPFDLVFTDTGIEGTVDGDTRTLVCTWPAGIVRPMYRMDGVRWYAGFADNACISKGAAAPQFSLALGVTAGRHRVEVSEWGYPVPPPVPAVHTLSLGTP
ncbi:MAG: hypothetical protein BWZ02_01371 [Lentisphaerae bacterium ADurb.BinA184]|nr:MAG: hypothetical protein BWZ02_01371 [Lentisphaerae bacterium ADurb.BinA184]